MRTALVIGIGTGNPEHLTLEGVAALRRAEAVVLLDKGEDTEDMRELRREILSRHREELPAEIVVPDPRRDPGVAARDYDRAVTDWHAERARRVAAALDEHTAPDAVVAFLVWGDPSLYDSTLRILDRMRDAGTPLDVQVIPGISALVALTAAFGLTANRIGEPIHVTTGRRLPDTPAELRRNVFVMLDGRCTFRDVAGPDTRIYWGAYLGTDREILVSGRVDDVAEEIVAARARAREEYGWIMDTYLLREG